MNKYEDEYKIGSIVGAAEGFRDCYYEIPYNIDIAGSKEYKAGYMASYKSNYISNSIFYDYIKDSNIFSDEIIGEIVGTAIATRDKYYGNPSNSNLNNTAYINKEYADEYKKHYDESYNKSIDDILNLSNQTFESACRSFDLKYNESSIPLNIPKIHKETLLSEVRRTCGENYIVTDYLLNSVEKDAISGIIEGTAKGLLDSFYNSGCLSIEGGGETYRLGFATAYSKNYIADSMCFRGWLANSKKLGDAIVDFVGKAYAYSDCLQNRPYNDDEFGIQKYKEVFAKAYAESYNAAKLAQAQKNITETKVESETTTPKKESETITEQKKIESVKAYETETTVSSNVPSYDFDYSQYGDNFEPLEDGSIDMGENPILESGKVR